MSLGAELAGRENSGARMSICTSDDTHTRHTHTHTSLRYTHTCSVMTHTHIIARAHRHGVCKVTLEVLVTRAHLFVTHTHLRACKCADAITRYMLHATRSTCKRGLCNY